MHATRTKRAFCAASVPTHSPDLPPEYGSRLRAPTLCNFLTRLILSIVRLKVLVHPPKIRRREKNVSWNLYPNLETKDSNSSAYVKCNKFKRGVICRLENFFEIDVICKGWEWNVYTINILRRTICFRRWKVFQVEKIRI